MPLLSLPSWGPAALDQAEGEGSRTGTWSGVAEGPRTAQAVGLAVPRPGFPRVGAHTWAAHSGHMGRWGHLWPEEGWSRMWAEGPGMVQGQSDHVVSAIWQTQACLSQKKATVPSSYQQGL